MTTGEAYLAVASGPIGLDSAEAGRRLLATGPNALDAGHQKTAVRLLVSQFVNPIILILIVATVLSMVIGDPIDGAVILAIIVASGAIGFWQEHRANQAVEALANRVRVHVEAMRDGVEVSVPVDEIVPGDLGNR